jgi:hypothetical protein
MFRREFRTTHAVVTVRSDKAHIPIQESKVNQLNLFRPYADSIFKSSSKSFPANE